MVVHHLSVRRSSSPSSPWRLAVLVVLAVLLTGVVPAQDTYQMPPKPIADLIDAPQTPRVSIDPGGTRMLILTVPNLPDIQELAQPELRLAGIRFNPRNNASSRASYTVGMSLRTIADGADHPVTGLPAAVKIRDVDWSPDGTHAAFTLVFPDRLELWTLDAATGRAARLIPNHLNAVAGQPFYWMPDSRSLVCLAIPDDRGPAPEKPDVPAGPVIQATSGQKSPARTYQDLLKTPHDQDLFAYYTRARILRVDLDGTVQALAGPDHYRRAEPSPDGRYILTEVIHRPFSYLVPVYRFPHRVDILDAGGERIRTLADLPLAENVPIGFGAVPEGPRRFEWRADAPATVVWVEARDGGNPRRDVKVRDEVLSLAAPFTATPHSLATLGLRYAGIEWGRADLALVSEIWWTDRRVHVWRIQPGTPDKDKSLLFDYSSEDRYHHPGSPVTRTTAAGRTVLLTGGDDGQTLYLSGEGASPEGNRPFLDALNLTTKANTRLWQSAAPYYERVARVLSTSPLALITRRESVTEPPNYVFRDLKADTSRALTAFPHPAPQLKEVTKELIRYQRADGVQLSGMLYLPPGYTPGDGPLPMLMWAYPREFKSAAAAAQITDSPHRFVRISWASPVIWTMMGYAVLDGPTMPIIGEGDREPNDTYVQQLVADAKAAVDEVVRRGVADPKRIAIGGHSYGAFMTANLLAHSDLYCAGIARSGAYNRTLTPFGFQSEERTLWQAPQVYFDMSPFMHADTVNEPILLIHGQADNNSGTFPMQSERFYNAVKGLGGTARLVMLPYESHGYRARESVMHVLWETWKWLDAYAPLQVPAAGQ